MRSGKKAAGIACRFLTLRNQKFRYNIKDMGALNVPSRPRGESKPEAKRRLTFGVFSTPMSGWYGNPFLAGLVDFTDRHDVNLVCFFGESPAYDIARQNLIFELASPQTVDGLILFAGLGHGTTAEEMEAFCQKYAPLPVVTHAIQSPGVYTVYTDGYTGMRELVEHLIEAHNHQRIAFIRGPLGQLEAEERYRAYADELAAHSMVLDPMLVVQGDYSTQSGREAARRLLERKTPFSALMGTNDSMAVGAVEVLQSLGKRIPADVAVVGFDDSAEARLLSVPLSTVRQSFHDLGYRTAEILFKRLHGEQVAEKVLVPPEVVIRQSCGCIPLSMRPVEIQPNSTGVPAPTIADLRRDHETMLDEMLRTLGNPRDEDTVWGVNVDISLLRVTLSSMVDAFLNEMQGQKDGCFIPALEQALQMLQVVRKDRLTWHDVISILHRVVIPALQGDEQILKAENLLQQARLMVGETAIRSQAYQRMQVEQNEGMISQISFALSTTLTIEALAATMEQFLPRMEIERCAIVLFRGAEDGFLEEEFGAQGKLVLSYENRKATLHRDANYFVSRRMLPQERPFNLDRYILAAVVLTVGSKPMGYVIFQVTRREWEMYSQLRQVLGGTLLRTMLVRQEETARSEVVKLLAEAELRAIELAAAKNVAEKARQQTQVALRETEELFRAAQSILGAFQVEEICRQLTVHLKNLVGADSLYVFLVNHELRKIELGVYEGKVIEEIQTDYKELTTGISGIAFSSGKPVLSTSADDGVEPEATKERRKRAGTGAIIVAPLVAHGTVIGTVTAANRIDQRVFSQHDVDLLMALTTQGASAIQNARLFRAEREEREFTEALRQAGVILTSTLDFNDLLERLLEQIQRVVPYDSGSIMLVEGGRARVARWRGPQACLFDLNHYQPFEISSTHSFHTIQQTGKPLVIADTRNEPGWVLREENAEVRSWVGVPIISQNGLIAFFSLNKFEANFYDERAANRLMSFASQAALALENARLYRDLRQFNQQLEDMVKARTEELERAYAQLERLDQTKSNFIGIASHELRTPITVLSGYSQMLETDATIKANDTLLNLVKGIRSGTLRLYEIVNSMLDMVKIDTRSLEIVHESVFLAVLIKDEATRFGKAWKDRQLKIAYQGLSELPPVEGDSEALRKVFQHLIGNAMKYTPDGGNITVSGRMIVENEQEFVDINVRDTGIGIDPQYLELIFVKFFQTGEVALHSTGATKFKGGGPGLGLTIARGIVEAHQGRIWADSPGYDEQACPGSQFHVLLPVKQEN
jgi:DNA-binding LacI/PurR family transcriptional regulator/signal transduction histidine kinase